MKNRKVHVVSLGCPKNQVDAEVMAAILKKRGFEITREPGTANIIIVNTCAFILPAKEEAIDEILRMSRLKKAGLCSHLVVTGCLSQRYGKTLEKTIPEVDLFLGIAEIPNIAHHLERLEGGPRLSRRSVVGKPDFLMNANHPRLLSTAPSTAYLKIADGCSNRCSYCVIPTIRGKARSRSLEDVLQEAQDLAKRGVKEIILTAQDTTAYGKDLEEKQNLGHLLKRLSTIKTIQWIRLLYTYPVGLTGDLLEIMKKEEKICHYIDMPIQHSDDAILRAMNRRGDSRQIRESIARVRTLIPDVTLRTSLITGFPGETKIRYNHLLDFIREIRFDHLGVFTYSREEGTLAARWPSRISEKEKQERKNLLMEEQAVISYEINQTLIGSRQDVLIEGKSDRPDYGFYGRCRRQAPEIDGITYIRGENLTIGKIAACTITDGMEYDLFADMA